MSRIRTPARGRLKGQNAGHNELSKRPGRFERAETRALDGSACLEEEAASIGAAGAPVQGRSLAGDTPILMADGSTRTLAALKPGDAIYGTVGEGDQRRYVKTQVLARWSVLQEAWRIRLEDGTQIVAGAGQRFLTPRGWTALGGGSGARAVASLKPGDELLGTGAFAQGPADGPEYRTGYLCGLLRGYAAPEPRTHTRGRVRISQQQPPPLTPCSGEAWQRAERYVRQWRPQVPRVPLALAGGRPVPSFRRPLVRPLHEEIQEAIAWPATASQSWSRGFLAGIFDAAGSYQEGVLRISHPDPAVIGRIGAALRLLNIERRLEITPQRGRSALAAVRIEGGVAEHLRFFQICNPAVSARRTLAGQPLSRELRLKVVAIEPLRGGQRLYDITTGTGDFIANGVVTHNCDPRPVSTATVVGQVRRGRRAKGQAVGAPS